MKILLKVGWLLIELAVMWGFEDRPALDDCSWAGQWKASTGVTLDLTQTGDQVQGSYQPKDGQVFGSVSGMTLTCTFADGSEIPSPKSGDLWATLAADCNSFSGQYRYNLDMSTLNVGKGDWINWSGIRVGGGPTPSQPTPSGPVAGKLVALTGTVEIHLPGRAWQRVTAGMDLPTNASIHTSFKSTATIQLANGEIVTIDDLSMLSMQEATSAQLVLLLTIGHITATAPTTRERGISSFEVKTATTALSVRGTVFSVSYDPQAQSSIVSVQEGIVDVTPTNPSLQPVTLQAGQQVQVTSSSISPVTSNGSPPASGGTPPPPPPSGGPSVGGSVLQIAEALDTDHNNKIDDDEIKTADVDWTTGQDIAGTNFTIGDDAMKQLFQMWVTGGSIAAAGISAAGAIPASSLQVRSIEARTLDTHSVRFVAEGQGITGVEAQIFDLSGKLVFDQATTGTALTFRGLNTDGRQLANGVYLYLVNVRGTGGETITSEVRKLVILR